MRVFKRERCVLPWKTCLLTRKMRGLEQKMRLFSLGPYVFQQKMYVLKQKMRVFHEKMRVFPLETYLFVQKTCVGIGGRGLPRISGRSQPLSAASHAATARRCPLGMRPAHERGLELRRRPILPRASIAPCHLPKRAVSARFASS